MSLEDFARSIGVPKATAAGLLDGTEPITIRLGQRIGFVLGGTTRFWVARDGQYRDDLATVEADRLAQSFPVAEMAAMGWIDSPREWHDRLRNLQAFFGVSSPEAWESRLNEILSTVRFRFARSQVTNPRAVASWLRRAEIEGAGRTTGEWDRDAFVSRLPGIRGLTTSRDPAEFLPELLRRCAEVGVIVVVLRAPRGCPASGAVMRLTDGKPVIVLSVRYRTDDHFWFTFFHEAAHAILHDPEATYVDEFEPVIGDAAPGAEKEADDFADVNLLLPETRERLQSVELTSRAIAGLARDGGVSPGIIVGQLQHLGRLGFSTRLNGFKRRYQWNGPSLERA
jgi:Zn-dependent peptidase ImmA (M78 family)/plasmid maintenance system antidote protein VapI